MKAHVILELLSKIRELKSVESVVVELEHLLIHYNFYYFGLYATSLTQENNGYEPLAERWPKEWLDLYQKNRLENVDPAHRYIHHTQNAFRWRDAVAAFKADPQRKKIERFVNDARKRGIEDGYVFPIHSRNGLIGKLVLSGRPVDLSCGEILLFDALAKAMYWQIHQLSDKTDGPDPVPDDQITVTKRELETLRLLAEGMTSIEIGRAMNISNHTVDWYMNGLQTKMKARNRQHIVAAGFRLGLIS